MVAFLQYTWMAYTFKKIVYSIIRSDIPIKGILPFHAQGFELTKGANILGSNLDKTIKMLELENYDLVMVSSWFWSILMLDVFIFNMFKLYLINEYLV